MNAVRPKTASFRLCMLLAATCPLPCAVVTAQELLQPPADAAPKPEAPSVEEAILDATEILDRIDAQWGETPSREDIEALNDLVATIQAAGPTEPRLDYLSGRTWALMGKSRAKAALRALQKFVETREGRNDWRAHRVIGDVFVDEFPRLALSSYERAAALKPGEPVVLLGLSRGYFEVGERQKALDYAKEAVAADRGANIRPIAHLARMYAANQQWDDANRMAVAALKKADQQSQAEPARRATLVTLQEQYDLLVYLLQSSVGAGQPTPEQYAALARYARERAGITWKLDLHDVLSALERAMEGAKPDESAPLLQEYGVTLAELGRTNQAIETFEKLLTLDPANESAKHWLAKLKSNPTAAATTSSRP